MFAVLTGMALVYFFFPRKEEEEELRASYHAADAGVARAPGAPALEPS